MATLKSSRQLADEAQILATSFEYVRYRDMVYVPVDYETGIDNPIPAPERKAWVPLSHKDMQLKALQQFDTMFSDPRELGNFYYRVWQMSQLSSDDSPDRLLVKTSAGLRVLTNEGQLVEPDGTFIPNMLKPLLNEDKAAKEEVLRIVTEWTGGVESEATSLLRHLATALSPGWSAGKYVLLIGGGRNGKSVLMQMLSNLFGKHNCSNVTRQEISEASQTLFDLNGSLLNVVYDGPETFLKDSGREKSLITGEEVWLRKLYQSTGTMVQTNALFIEGLNNEPRSKDKSSALQARLVRFWFPNRYVDDPVFLKRMLSEPVLGAFLSLLIDHFVKEHETSVMLAPTQRSLELQLEHMEENSLAMQFIMHVDDTDPLGAESLIGMSMDDLCAAFTAWRLSANDLTAWDPHSIQRMFRPVIDTERRSTRVNGQPRKKRFITKFSRDAENLLAMQKEDEDADATAVVDD